MMPPSTSEGGLNTVQVCPYWVPALVRTKAGMRYCCAGHMKERQKNAKKTSLTMKTKLRD
jgi:hypothetical protein